MRFSSITKSFEKSKRASNLALVCILAVLLFGVFSGLHIVLGISGHLSLQVAILVLLQSQLDCQILVHIGLILLSPIEVVAVRDMVDKVIFATSSLPKVRIHYI